MDLLAALRTNELERFKQTFSWRTKEGVTKRLPDMDTTHLFNTAKLLLNKFTEEQKANLYRRGPNSYACQTKNGQTIFFMVWEIEQRDNLDKRYRITYQQMLNSVFDQQFLFQELPQAIRPTQPPAEPAGLTPEQARNSLSEFGRAFYGVDYADMEVRVMGRFATDEPEATLDMRNLGTMHLSTQMMREHLRPYMSEGTLDATQWMSFVPEPFRERAQEVFSRIVGRHISQFSRQSPETLEQIIAEFQQEKAAAIQSGELTNRGWVRLPEGRSTAAREEELLGTRAFTPEQMFELIDRGSQTRHMDLTLWRLTIPEHFKEGADWVIDENILRRLGNLRVSRNVIHQFVQNFQDFKQTAIRAGDLTRTGWITPAAYRSESERRARREEDERRGRGRTRALDYLRMMQQTMGPQFETQLMPLLERNPGNRDLLQEFRYRYSRPEAGLRGRNPLLMVMDEMPPNPAYQTQHMVSVKKEPPKNPDQQVEELTQFGKRKIQLDDGDSNG